MTENPAKDCTYDQYSAFEKIAIGQDEGHSIKILAALVDAGLIEPVRGGGWQVPTPIHMQWCGWCSENITDEELEDGPDSSIELLTCLTEAVHVAELGGHPTGEMVDRWAAAIAKAEGETMGEPRLCGCGKELERRALAELFICYRVGGGSRGYVGIHKDGSPPCIFIPHRHVYDKPSYCKELEPSHDPI